MRLGEHDPKQKHTEHANYPSGSWRVLINDRRTYETELGKREEKNKAAVMVLLAPSTKVGNYLSNCPAPLSTRRARRIAGITSPLEIARIQWHKNVEGSFPEDTKVFWTRCGHASRSSSTQK